MPEITKQQAVELLTKAVEEARPDDLAEIHNELFPAHPVTEDKAAAASSSLVQKIVTHMANGLEVEELVDLWNVVFPHHRRVWFDEGQELIHYDEEQEPAETAE